MPFGEDRLMDWLITKGSFSYLSSINLSFWGRVLPHAMTLGSRKATGTGEFSFNCTVASCDWNRIELLLPPRHLAAAFPAAALLLLLLFLLHPAAAAANPTDLSLSLSLYCSFFFYLSLSLLTYNLPFVHPSSSSGTWLRLSRRSFSGVQCCATGQRRRCSIS